MIDRTPFRTATKWRSSVLDRPFRWGLAMGDRSPGLSILLFHRVLAAADPFRAGDMTAVEFEAVVCNLARNFSVLPLQEGIERLSKNSLPRAALSITFDDGYRDNLEVAMPILTACGLPATFFIATGFLDGSWMWNDRIIEACKRTHHTSTSAPSLGMESIYLGTEGARVTAAHAIIEKVKYLPFDERHVKVAHLESQLEVRLDRGPMLDPDGVRRLRSQGMTIGAHTVTHPILAQIDDARARAEVHDCRNHLVEVLREPISLFAYPNGRPGQDYQSKHVDLVAKAGFAAAVSTSPLTARPGMSHYELPRFTPWDRTEWRFAARLALKRTFDERQLAAAAV